MRNTLREGLAIPRVLLNPFRLPKSGKAFGLGRAALVIPGLTTGDISTTLLRRTLRQRGFLPEGWRQGINIGADAAKLKKLETRIAQMRRETGKKVVLIGWSLGGLYARVLAHRCAEDVDMVVTVASPFSGDRHANRAWKLYEAINDHTVDNPPFPELVSAKPPVPTIAVWSATDGIVSPQSSRGKEGEADHTLRIDAPHFTLGTSSTCIDKILAKMAEVDAARE
ncbi:alpha/beta fold hydrolase [Aurantiacibacter rhizosphaerae]|uniref:Alpha/beta fold hydrolase n=1 Tax=Aurantiacibacter rhizosphaerae TaxID=2691582 RepID=A0A844XE67_9SPHN|nr:alpha/beta fold hydrolase [Aurantiacibacter rhizosphaerae]MWV27894.1 alpha/beta fold hydrolase [Aurantiacibacter rhizosphaerae]